MKTVVKWSGREARALREARRMSVRAFAAHLQEILDQDFIRASDDIRDRFEATLNSTSATSTSDDAQRLEPALTYPTATDLDTATYLRGRVAALDAEYDHAPSASLLAAAGRRHGQIALLLTRTGDSRVQRELVAATAESAILMGQLVRDVSLRREHAAAMYYFDAAAEAATSCGGRVAACRAQMRIDEPLPETEHDFRVDAVVTPEAIIACTGRRRPDGVLWDHHAQDKIDAIPFLTGCARGQGVTEAGHRWS